ncbi:MAG: response regulator, partial [Xanthobacteraceae bacterium]
MANARKILIVDDDPDLLEMLVDQLALHDEFEPIPAKNGTQALEAARSGQIELVIMDIWLPDIDGREGVRMLRKDGFRAP